MPRRGMKVASHVVWVVESRFILGSVNCGKEHSRSYPIVHLLAQGYAQRPVLLASLTDISCLFGWIAHKRGLGVHHRNGERFNGRKVHFNPIRGRMFGCGLVEKRRLWRLPRGGIRAWQSRMGDVWIVMKCELHTPCQLLLFQIRQPSLGATAIAPRRSSRRTSLGATSRETAKPPKEVKKEKKKDEVCNIGQNPQISLYVLIAFDRMINELHSSACQEGTRIEGRKQTNNRLHFAFSRKILGVE